MEYVRAEWKEMVNELCEAESGLTGWEIDFLESLSGKGEGEELTDRQWDKLCEIYDRLMEAETI